MKFKLHIPTESYGFIECEVDNKELPDREERAEMLISIYQEIRDAWHNPDKKTTCIKCREHIDVKEEASKLFDDK